MSTAQPAGFAGGGGKKAVHVKWAGKTIALGTFPSAEADEKCARAKALTRAWRSTMRPKPSRDWVMLELERLGVRVVSGRLGRKAGEDDDGEKKGGGPPTADRSNSIGWTSENDLNNLMKRRSSSIGFSVLGDDLNRRGSLSSLGPIMGLDGGDPSMPNPRGSILGSSGVFDPSRGDPFGQTPGMQERRASGLGMMPGGGALGGGSGMPDMAANPNKHYEMLKLHHMNLLNEIQETTLMMNLYQQQQLQQQQQQLQQQARSSDQQSDPQLSMMLQQQQGVAGGGMDPMFGGGMAQNRGSLGFGGNFHRGSVGMGDRAGLGGPHDMQMRQQQMPQHSDNGGASGNDGNREQAELEDRLQKLKDDIARRQKEADELQSDSKSPPSAGVSGEKRQPEDETGENSQKRIKLENV